MKETKVMGIPVSIGFISLVLLVILVASLVGCSSSSPSTSAPAPAAPTTQAAPKTTAAPAAPPSSVAPAAPPSSAAPAAPASSAAATTAAAPAKVFKMVVNVPDPPNGSWNEVYDPFYAAVEKRTNGGIKFEKHYNGELAGFFENYDAAAQGTVDMAQTMPGMYPNLFPLEDIASIVWYDVKCLARSQMYTELTAEFPEMSGAYEKSGTHLVWKTATFPNQSCMGKGKAVKTVDDFKGKKYLSTGPWDAATWTAMGMTPLSMMPSESYLNLQTGVCDGATLTLGSLFDFGWGDVTPFVTDSNVRPGEFAMVMNLKKWNSLPPDYQNIITEEAAKVPAAQDAQQNRFDRDLRPQAVKKWGTTFYTFTAADFAKMNDLTAPVKVKFAADLDGKKLPGTKLIAEAQRLEKKYSDPQYGLAK